MNDVIREFLLETHENLAQLDADLIALEKEPTERQILARVFRNLHTVKGSAGFLGLTKLQAVAHSAESLLSRLRASELTFNPPIATALLQTVDAIRQVLASIEAEGAEGHGDYADLIRELDRLRESGGVAAPPAAKVIESTHPVPVIAATSATLVSEPSVSMIHEPTEPRATAVSDSSIRVDVGLLDKLMNLVGELVLARNQVMQFSTSQENRGFLGTVQRLNLLTTELQANVMKTRMQPIANIWSKFPRVVRDLAVACGKQVRIEMEGQETELDKTIIEAIRDPLTHMIRNAVDHGIESPAVRLERGKSAEGRLSLHAFHEGGKVIIEISDDGGGIDPARVRDKAIKVKAISPEEAGRMNERELVNLVFLPGFSTTEKVTNFSGRGVGMDVVRTNIERIGGSVELESQPGRGTSVRMKIPLTLAIIPALTVSSGGERYAIPQVSLLELVRLEGDDASKKIESIHGFPVYRLRGKLLPIVYLSHELRVDNPDATQGEVLIVVLQADDRQFGLVVNAIHDTEEIVVKPLQKHLKGVNVFAGATIMGDGRVALILDVLALAHRASITSGSRSRAATDEATADLGGSAGETKSLVVFSTRDGGRMGIPLSMVARLEEFPRSNLERTGDRYLIQYRGDVLPLIDVARALSGDSGHRRPLRKRGRRTTRSKRAVPVIVCTRAGRPIGLIVARILDIVEAAVTVTTKASRPGVLHSAVVQDRVTEMLDVEWLVHTAAPEFSGSPVASSS